jgi:hypothetical protein
MISFKRNKSENQQRGHLPEHCGNKTSPKRILLSNNCRAVLYEKGKYKY